RASLGSTTQKLTQPFPRQTALRSLMSSIVLPGDRTSTTRSGAPARYSLIPTFRARAARTFATSDRCPLHDLRCDTEGCLGASPGPPEAAIPSYPVDLDREERAEQVRGVDAGGALASLGSNRSSACGLRGREKVVGDVEIARVG